MKTVNATVEMKLDLSGLGKAKIFVEKLKKQSYSADVISGDAVVDGKDFAKVSALDLSAPVKLAIHAEPKKCDEFINWLGSEDMLYREIA